MVSIEHCLGNFNVVPDSLKKKDTMNQVLGRKDFHNNPLDSTSNNVGPHYS